jgi:group I intron endonuclease
MTIGIYKIINDINSRIYVGQSIDCETRWKGHLYEAAHRANTVIDSAIRKYGQEHFKMIIVEECSTFELDDKEREWIEKEESYEKGYNSTLGGKSLRGEKHPKAILKEADVIQIRKLYSEHIPFRVVYEKYKDLGISKRGLQKVWRNDTWKNISQEVYTEENKQWHRRYSCGVKHNLSQKNKLTEQEIFEILEDYRKGKTISEISKEHKRDYGTIQKYINCPESSEKIRTRGRAVKNLETGKIFPSISAAARWSGCGATTLARLLNSNKPAGRTPDEEEAHFITIE